ncbi:MAG: pentapeptide repeat-containing protein [Pseudomonadota bacterium]
MPDSDETPEAPNDRNSPGLFAQLGKGLLRFDIWLGEDPTGRSFKTLAVLVLGTFAAVIFIPLIITPLFVLLGKMGDGIATLGTGEGEVSAAVRNYALLYATLIGAPFLVWRTWLAQRQAQTARENLTLAQGNAVNETFTKAIEMLGAGTTEAPILEQRLGAIYALERLARDNPDYNIQIMETFCAYLREHASGKGLVAWPKKIFDRPEDEDLSNADIVKTDAFKTFAKDTGITGETLKQGWGACLEAWKQPPEFFREDLRAVLDVIGRRSDPQRAEEAAQSYSPDLRGLNLRFRRYNGRAFEGADLTGAWLEGANLSGARMQGADLSEVQMQGADLIGAQMQGAELIAAQMQGAVLSGAQMQGADLSRAKMQGAFFEAAMMREVRLLGAKMQYANLNQARIQATDLKGAQLQNSGLRLAFLSGAKEARRIARIAKFTSTRSDGCALRSIDLSEAYFDNTVDFQNTFADATVKTPTAFVRPRQWAKVALLDEEFWGRWRGWLDLGGKSYEWKHVAPEGFEDVTPIPPPEGCEWKTGPLNPE